MVSKPSVNIHAQVIDLLQLTVSPALCEPSSGKPDAGLIVVLVIVIALANIIKLSVGIVTRKVRRAAGVLLTIILLK